jgi:hypothetical protein
MDCTWKAAAMRCSASTSTLARTQRPAYSAASFSRIGDRRAAWAAPGGPQVQDDRHRHRAVDDLGLEGRLGHVDDDPTRHPRPGGLRLLLVLLGGREGSEVDRAAEWHLAHPPIVLHHRVVP